MVKSQKKKGGVLIGGRIVMLRWLVIPAVLLTIGGVVGWWHIPHSNPTRVFWGAIDNSFQVSSLSKQTLQGQEGQSFNQKVYIRTTGSPIAIGTNEVIQTGDASFHVKTSVVGTPGADYVRYDSVTTDQKNADGKLKDFSPIQGIWGKTTTSGASQTNGQLFNQSILGVLPSANLSLSQRKELIKLIRDQKVYTADFAKVNRQIVSGRPVYTYNVNMSAQAYIRMLNKYGEMVGLTQLKNTNPDDFKTAAPIQFQFVVDVWTQQIKKVQYVGSARVDLYGSVGIKSRFPAGLPANAIPIQELQQRVQAIE